MKAVVVDVIAVVVVVWPVGVGLAVVVNVAEVWLVGVWLVVVVTVDGVKLFVGIVVCAVVVVFLPGLQLFQDGEGGPMRTRQTLCVRS